MKRSLVAEGFDGVETRGFPRGIEAEDDPLGGGNRDRSQHPFGTGFDRPFELTFHQQCRAASEQDAHDPGSRGNDKRNQMLGSGEYFDLFPFVPRTVLFFCNILKLFG